VTVQRMSGALIKSLRLVEDPPSARSRRPNIWRTRSRSRCDERVGLRRRE